MQDALARRPSIVAPGQKRRLRGLGGGINIGGAASGDIGERLKVDRRQGFKRLTRQRRTLFAADVIQDAGLAETGQDILLPGQDFRLTWSCSVLFRSDRFARQAGVDRGVFPAEIRVDFPNFKRKREMGCGQWPCQCCLRSRKDYVASLCQCGLGPPCAN